MCSPGRRSRGAWWTVRPRRKTVRALVTPLLRLLLRIWPRKISPGANFVVLPTGKRGRIRTYELFSDHTCTQVQTRRFTVPCFGRLLTLLYYLDNVVSIALFIDITSDPQALQRCQQNRTLSVPYATWNLFRITLHVGQ